MICIMLAIQHRLQKGIKSMKQPFELFHALLSGKKSLRIKLLGDSITHGYGGTGFRENGVPFIERFARNPEGYCWANLFQKYMAEKFGCETLNNGCCGVNIEYIIKNFDVLVEDADDLIICTIGTNNRHFYFKNGSKPTREAYGTQFYNNIFKLNDLFRKSGKAYIFVANIPAVSEGDGPDYWRVLHMDDINAIYKKAQEKLGFPFISLYDLMTDYCATNQMELDSLLADRLHPNDHGYDVMFKLLVKALGLDEV